MAPAKPTSRPATALTCSEPVEANDTAASLRQRFGDEARIETLQGPEGTELPAVVLWPDDPKRRVEVVFADEARRSVSFAQLTEAAEWRVAGLAIGDPVGRVQVANDRPFELWGFGWDYGGYVSDFKGGKLEELRGGCGVMLRLGPGADAAVPDELMGEVLLSSDDSRLEAAGVRIEELALSFSPE